MTKNEYLGYVKYLECLKSMKESLNKQMKSLKPKKLVRDGVEMKSLQDLRDWMDTGCVTPTRYDKAVERFETTNKEYFEQYQAIGNATSLINKQIENIQMNIRDYEGNY